MLIDRNNSLSAMASLMDAIHDRWFDLSDISFSEPTREFVLYYGERKQEPHEKRLKVRGVTRLHLWDEARIGTYDINEILVDVKSGRITVTSGFPLKIELELDEDWEIILETP